MPQGDGSEFRPRGRFSQWYESLLGFFDFKDDFVDSLPFSGFRWYQLEVWPERVVECSDAQAVSDAEDAEAAPDSPSEGPAGQDRLEFLDGDGAVVHWVPLRSRIGEVLSSNPGSPHRYQYIFHAKVCERPGFESYRLVRVSAGLYGSAARLVLFELEASAHAPQVEIVSPASGQVFDGEEVSLSWTASDADGPVPPARVYFSSDGGLTYGVRRSTQRDLPRIVVEDRVSGVWTLTVSRRAFDPSERARFLVVVHDSDGVRWTAAESETFVVEGAKVSIGGVGDGVFDLGDGVVDLTATAALYEDGEWTDAAGGIFWLSHRAEYPLGTGTELRVQVDALGEGTHRVTASTTDSSGAIYSDTVEITVEHSQPRPYTW